MKKTTFCLTSLALLTACSAEDSNNSKTENPYYKAKKIKTDGGVELEEVTISGPPTPPKGFERPVAKSDISETVDINATYKKDLSRKPEN